MSYVLEALKKAQAQREQGAVPGIHSLQVPYVAVEGKPRSNLKPVLWFMTVLLLVVLALMAWRMSANTTELRDIKPAAAPVTTQTATVMPTPVSVPDPEPEALSKGEVQVPVSASEERTEPKKKALTTSNEAAKQATKAPRVYAVAELPDAIRRDLPTLVISGGSYSSNPAQRLIIVNNQVFTEGSQPVPAVVVQRIEPAAAVLSFRGYSYRVGY